MPKDHKRYLGGCVDWSRFRDVRSAVAVVTVVNLLTQSGLAQPSQAVVVEINRGVEALTAEQFDLARTAFLQAVATARTTPPTPVERLQRAQSLAESGAANEALEIIDRVLKQTPNLADGHALRGTLLVRTGHMNAGLAALQRALELNPEEARAADEISNALGSKDRVTAVKVFEQLGTKAPDSITLKYYLGHAYEGVGNYERAAKMFIEALDKKPDSIQLNQALTSLLQKSGPPDAGARTYERLAKLHATPAIELYYSDALIRANQKDAAIVLLRKLAASDGAADVSFRNAVAQALAEAGEYDEAARQGKRVLEALGSRNDETLPVHFNVGRWLVRAGKLDESIKHLETALRLHLKVRSDPPNAINFQLGNAYHKAGQKEKAELYFRQFEQHVISGGVTDPETVNNLTDIYVSDRNYSAAATVLERALRLATKEEEDSLRLRYARVLLELGKTHDAIAQVQKIENKEGQRSGKLLLARAYLFDGHLGQATDELQSFKQSGESGPDVGEWALLWGRTIIAAAASDPNAARKAKPYIEQAFNENPKDEERANAYAYVLLTSGDANKAEEVYQAVLKEHRQSPEALIGLGEIALQEARHNLRLSSKLKALENALARFRVGLQAAPSNTAILSKILEAQRARAEFENQASRYQRWLSGALIALLSGLAPSVLAVALWRILRQNRGAATMHDIIQLEAALKRSVRVAAIAKFGSSWEVDIGTLVRPERFPLKALRRRKEAQEVEGQDILDVCNFGHLVPLLEDAWLTLNVAPLLTERDRKLVLSNIEYLAACRTLYAHPVVDGSNSHGSKDKRSSVVLPERDVRRALEFVRDKLQVTENRPARSWLGAIRHRADMVS